MTDPRFKLDLAALESRFLNLDDMHLEFLDGVLVGFVCIANPAKPYRPNDLLAAVRQALQNGHPSATKAQPATMLASCL